jgi:hypothetical protein
MKLKKAVKRLRKTQQWLSALRGQWDDVKTEVRELLAAADNSVSDALALVETNASRRSEQPASRRKKHARASARQARNGRFTDARRKKLSLAAKRRWAAAKRKGARTLARQA